ncbi:uncharacterized protein LOC125431893 isoform X2 [Sphaerodactylus townsendi]|uniref:uncharacterized protein LOC125431893 isoform X2 n=1 Tax=Sphaerodactylus townsendi TaxID=933632 RepID=UPI0020269E3D|nr:uncharacterized protein LOC125431893 isoform X2 [Sphaerodactylus townsendi]
METQLFDQEKEWPDSTPAVTAKSFEMSKIKNETKRESHYYSQETNSSSSCVTHLIYSEKPLRRSTVVGQFSTDEHHEENQLDKELMDTSDYKTTDNPNKHFQPLSRPHLDKNACRAHEVTLLKLKLKAITCSDFKHPSQRTNSTFQFGETKDVEASSSEDDDVSTELPMEVLENLHKMYTFQANQGHVVNTDVFLGIAENNPEEKKWNEYKTSVQLKAMQLPLRIKKPC